MSSLEINNIYHFDCLVGLKQIETDSVSIVIADPPYNIGKSFGNNKRQSDITTYVEWCKLWLSECKRILKPNGTMFVYGFSEIVMYLGVFIETELELNIRWLIWNYTNKTIPSLQFWQRSHESILCCYGNDKVFHRDNIREPYSESYKKCNGRTRKGTSGRFGTTETTYQVHEKGALPRDVIRIPALAGGAGRQERVNHPTQKPLALCEKLLKSCCVDNGLVVIPFCGSGSEVVKCVELELPYIAFELNEEYITLAYSRLK